MSTRSDVPAGVRAIVDNLSGFKTESEHLDVQGISDSVEALLKEISSEDPGEIIADAVSRGILSQAQGNKVLEVSMWSGETQGKELSATLERWLSEGTSPVKIELALAPAFFPFATQKEMAEVLSSIARRFPHLAPPLQEMLERRKAQGV